MINEQLNMGFFGMKQGSNAQIPDFLSANLSDLSNGHPCKWSFVTTNSCWKLLMKIFKK